MRKILVLASMLAMMMVAAAPAFADATAGDVDILLADVSQDVAVDVTQSQFGDATATAGDIGSAADASIDNSLDVSVTQVNAGVGGVAAGGDVFVDFPLFVFDGDFDDDGVLDDFDVDDDNDGIFDDFDF